MNDERPQTQIDHEAMEILQAYNLLSEHPDARAERIIEHYACMAHHAMVARKLLHDLRYHPEPPESAREMLRHMVSELQRQHALSLGIKLEWPPMPAEWVLRPELRRRET